MKRSDSYRILAPSRGKPQSIGVHLTVEHFASKSLLQGKAYEVFRTEQFLTTPLLNQRTGIKSLRTFPAAIAPFNYGLRVLC